jgi:Carboxypeptidase regulatory-like domain/Concanavalin A-like lectin/glucanases superfamily
MKPLLVSLVLSIVLISCSSDDVVAPTTVPGSIKGVVKHPFTKLPVADVQVYTVPGTSVRLTDNNGAYSMENVVPGDYLVRAFYRDTATPGHAVVPIRVEAGAVTTADLMLSYGAPETGLIIGRVVDEAGQPIKGADVTITSPYKTTVTAADGSFLFFDVTPGPVTITATSVVLQGSATINVRRDDVSKITITVYDQDPAKGSITGSVTVDNKPLEGALVVISKLGRSVTTDANGSYRLKNVEEGPYILTVSKEGLRTRDFDVEVSTGLATIRNIDMSPNAPAFSTKDLELFLPFGGSINDLSPRARDMKNIGDPCKLVADRFGEPNQAVEFNGTNAVSTISGQAMNYKALTMGAWIYSPSTSPAFQLIMGKTVHPNGDGYYMTFDNGLLNMLYTTNAFATYTRFIFSNAKLPRDQWVWVGFSLDQNGSGWASINGTVVMQSNNSVYSTATTSPAQVQIGDLQTSSTLPGFTGMMDHVVLYSRSMSVDEFKVIMETKD